MLLIIGEYIYGMVKLLQILFTLIERGVNMKKRLLNTGLAIFLSAAIFTSAFSAAAQNDTDQQNSGTIISSGTMQAELVYSTAYKNYLTAAQNGNTDEYGEVTPDPIPGLSSGEISLSPHLSGSSSETFASSYDPRPLGLTTPVKHQHGKNTCGIFTALASMESYAVKPDKFGVKYDLSENFYHYLFGSDAFSATEVNPYAPERRYIISGKLTGLNGESVFGAAASGMGPILENEFPDSSYTGYLENDDGFHKTPSLYLYDFVYEKGIDHSALTPAVMQNRVKEIKRLIKETGSCLLDYNPYYDRTNTKKIPYCTNFPVADALVNSSVQKAHSVLIVGWDDNFSKDNFILKPQNNGAFLVKDTDASEENAYSYVSYEDYFVCTQSLKTVADMSQAKRYENTYSYMTTMPEEAYFDMRKTDKTPYYANIYDLKSETPEQLEAVGVFTLYENSEIEIYVNPLSGSLSNTGMQKVYSGTLARPGYKTITLDTPVSLAGSDGQYAVAVKLLSDASDKSDGYHTLPVEKKNYVYPDDPTGHTYRPGSPENSLFSADDGVTWATCSSPAGTYDYAFCVTGYTSSIPAQNAQTLDVKFYKPSGWDDNLTIRLKNSGVSHDGSFAMTNLGNGVFGYTNSGVAKGTIVITDGAGHTSVQAEASGKCAFAEGQIVQRAQQPIKISFKKPTNWNNNIKIYYYTNDEREVELKSWPGFAMQNDGGNWYSYTITDMADARVIFTDGTNQTPAMLQPGYEVKSGQSFVYQDGEYIYEDGTPLSVQFRKPDSWSSTVSIQLLDQSAQKLPMTSLGNGLYEYNAKDLTRSDIIISDSNGNQSARLVAAGLVTVKNNLVFARPKEPIEVYFHRQVSWWKDIKIYYYSQSGYHDLCGWPGTSMTNIGAWWYKSTITDMDNIRVMFTDVTNQLPGQNQDGIALKSGERLVVNKDGAYRIESINQEVILDEY